MKREKNFFPETQASTQTFIKQEPEIKLQTRFRRADRFFSDEDMQEEDYFGGKTPKTRKRRPSEESIGSSDENEAAPKKPKINPNCE